MISHIIQQLTERSLPILPVIQVNRAEEIIPIANALATAGINALEITLRSAAGIEAIKLAKQQLPNAIICAGTVTQPNQLEAVMQAGAEFVVTPGISKELVNEAASQKIPMIPGVATPSDIMLGLNAGLDHFKLFPAAIVGGIAMLKSLQGPFPGVRFCPTGGLNANNFTDYLALPNVFCIGGSWMIVRNEQGLFEATATANAAAEVARSVQSIL